MCWIVVSCMSGKFRVMSSALIRDVPSRASLGVEGGIYKPGSCDPLYQSVRGLRKAASIHKTRMLGVRRQRGTRVSSMR